MPVTVTSYNLQLHTSARDELQQLPDEYRERMTDALTEIAATRQPTTHPATKQMNGGDLFRVRAGDYRAIAHLDKPDLLILRVGHRSHIFSNKKRLGNRLDA
jgi:mRNA-degrading endonuclease RelE of RelBE toxin-antitoxin system